LHEAYCNLCNNVYVKTMREKPMTVEQLWSLVERSCYRRGKRWDREAERLYERHIRPALAEKPVQSVRPGDMEKLHASLKATPIEANRTLAVAAAMFKYAERWEYRELGTNPCQHVRRYKETSRRRFATPEELARLGAVLDREARNHTSGIAFLYLLLYSGARPSEIERATWGQLDGNVLRVPDGKTGHRNVFLPAQAMAVVRELRPADCHPKRSIVGCKMPRRLWAAIRAEIGVEDLWARDLRRTFATVGLSHGASLGVVGELLGHRDPKTTKIYAKLMDAPAVQASAVIADKMAQLLNGEPKS
jgi:integrase